MRTFGTQGPVTPEINYVVSRSEALSDFVDRVKKGKYIVLFAPRQTGKTTLFRAAIDILITEAYFPIQLNFEVYVDLTPAAFYSYLHVDVCRAIASVFQRRGSIPSEDLKRFLENIEVTDHVSMRNFFNNLPVFCPVMIIPKKLSLSLTSSMPSRQKPFVVFYIRFATFILTPQVSHVPTVSVLLGSKTSRSSTTIGQSHLSISKTSFTCPTSHICKSRNYSSNIPTRWGKPSRLTLSSLFTNTRLDNPFSSIGVRKFSLRNWTFLKLNRLRWLTFLKHIRNSLRKGTSILVICLPISAGIVGLKVSLSESCLIR